MASRDGVPESSGDTAVAEAVARAVREGGRQLSTDPRRVRGMVNDVLGSESRTRRAEVDAVVVAAEESVPDDLISGRIGTDEAVSRLSTRGLDVGVASFAVDVWRYALGMLGDGGEPPSLPTSREVTSPPTTTNPIPLDTVTPVINASGTPPDTCLESPATTGSRRRLMIVTAAAVLGLLIVGLLVLANGDDNNETVADEPLVESSVPEPTVVELDSGSSMVQIPSEIFVIGSTEVEVRAVLEAPPFEFTVNRNQKSSPTVPAGTVMEIRPGPGELIPSGSGVLLIVSAGPEPVRVPVVVGISEVEAANTLREAGLVPSVLYVDVAFGSTEDGHVISQSLPVGVEVDPGSEIAVAVGRAVATFPDLTGQTFVQAEETLVAAGFVVNSLLGTEEGTFVSASVDGLELSPGAQFPRGTLVDLVFL